MQLSMVRGGLLVLMISGIVACGNNSNTADQKATGHQHEAVAADSVAPAAPASLKDAKLNDLYLAYLDLKTALVNGDSASASSAARSIETAGTSMANKDVAALAAKLVAVSGLKEQRELFGELSSLMIPLVKQSGLSSGKIYVEYCPMAFDNKGASWLSNEEAIRNPYFGDEMLTCGEVTDTLQ
ncbi:DUF3347 domain-containing protein [Flavihumibacter stibioxidans]|uniref:DUF3347 domain-containing protein n=1 Tax=Flavihumibacter stibioxidans TaxID=1834163 RepID=A0ABR7M5J3_9BACT|nr:DUF3347 domain-containing protein [Flavihumibacter stibioxidans]MBC6490252.1 hypothetical protein [Flavihumibacter stibioxidans]